MSETITIREVDQQKTLSNVDKLKTKKQGGGYVYWVPEEDVQTTTKHITKNGTYKAKDDDKYGYSEVTVNVPGGSGSADSSGKPSGTILPGGAGSAIVGEDEDGNDAVIGVDENGKMVKTPLPSSIEIVTNPTKMNYVDSETIDLSGAVVVAKMADGTTWTDADHPNGHVSCSPEPDKADASQAQTGGYTSDLDLKNVVKPIAYTTEDVEVRYYTESIPGTLVWSNSGKMAVFYDPSGFASCVTVSPENTGNMYYTYGGQTVQYSGTSIGASRVDRPSFVTQNLNVSYYGKLAGKIAWTLQYGTAVPGGQEITLNWARPGDGKVLSTTMEINVSAHTTESSSGTGGGGTF